MSRIVCAFTFEGLAVAKQRPKFSARGAFVRTWTPAQTRAFEAAVGVQAQLAMRDGGSMEVEEPVGVNLLITRAPLKSWSKKKAAAMHGRWAIGTRDLDNQVKAIFDGLNKIAFMDDRQVAHMNVTRRWGHTERFHITIVAGEPEAVS